MRVCINFLESNENIGPIIFAKRLAKELEKKGIKIVNRNSSHDILLAIIRDSKIKESRKKGAKIVQRLDGIYHNLESDYLKENKPIKETFREADSVIFQSEFNKKMVEKYFNWKKEKNFIIHNGADPKTFQYKKNNEKNIFLASAKWRESKRLESIIEGFNFAGIQNSELWILGKPDYISKKSNIKYFGEIPSQKTPSFYENASFFIQLSKNDSCPNSVIEALVSGLPVLGTSSGGIKELVKNSGEIIKENESLEPFYFSKTEKISKEEVAEGIYSLIQNRNRYEFPRKDLHISNCAKNYIKAFEETLDRN